MRNFIALSLIFVVLLQSCLSIKSEAPAVIFYKLNQEFTQNTKAEFISIDKSIYVQSFTAPAELASEKIIVENGEKITKYDYHQWISPLDEILTDFTINRFLQKKIFTKGVLSSLTILPDLMLECRIVSCKIDESNSSVELTLAANISSLGKTSSGLKPVISNTYSKILNYDKSLAGRDKTIKSAAIALSKCAAEIVDEIIFDINLTLQNASK